MFMPEKNVILTGNKEEIINLLHKENLITVGTLYDDVENHLENKETIYIN